MSQVNLFGEQNSLILKINQTSLIKHKNIVPTLTAYLHRVKTYPNL